MLQAMANLLSLKPKHSRYIQVKMHGCSDGRKKHKKRNNSALRSHNVLRG